METITPLSALASLSTSGSPCEGLPSCSTEASASCLPPTSEGAKTSLFSKGLPDDNDDDTPEVPACALDLEALIANIQLQLSHRTELPLKARLKIKELMRLFDASTGELDRYTFFDPSKKYTRNLIACDDTFTLMLLCWNPAIESPIHDHPCRNGCYVKVVEGTILEHQYVKDEDANKLTLTQVNTGSEGDVLYIDDGIGFHKIGVPSATQPARTLHIYSPPFSKCRIWLDECALDKPLRPTVTYFSEYGQIVKYEEETSALCGR